MAWIDFEEFDPVTLEHAPHAHGEGAEQVQRLLNATPEDEIADLTKRIQAHIPPDVDILGVEECQQLIDTATPEQLKAMRTRRQELCITITGSKLGGLAVAS